ncbi:hypothetical protein LTR53_003137 [Teratosphaeriaceae sp. CCFEE 6253]|nr:hypothetical protein LTR53_003137 [Teratosphaeriaceae sp. CCFEE 6253]
MRTVFSVEEDTGRQNSLVMDGQSQHSNRVDVPSRGTVLQSGLPTPSPSPDGRVYSKPGGMLKGYVEVFDYIGGARFRGFVAEKEDERSMFVFFDTEVIGKDLKPGLLAMLELTDSFDCSELVVCLDRHANDADVRETIRDLGWVGFGLVGLDSWSGESGCTSSSWTFLSMEV